MTNVLELRGITKRFPGVLANDKVDITLREGKILALLGENGAGKTTLMNILYGLYKPDEGTILVRGQEVDIHGPNDAIARGIGMVHQHFMLVPVMTVTENVMLGVEPTIRPSRRTVISSATFMTSFNLCVMKMIDLPLSISVCRILNSPSTSWGVSTAVGSSRMRISAARYKTLMISTRCWMPTGKSLI